MRTIRAHQASLLGDIAVEVAHANSVGVGEPRLARNRADSVGALGRIGEIPSTGICCAVIIGRATTAIAFQDDRYSFRNEQLTWRCHSRS